jgi:hypothetical protein
MKYPDLKHVCSDVPTAPKVKLMQSYNNHPSLHAISKALIPTGKSKSGLISPSRLQSSLSTYVMNCLGGKWATLVGKNNPEEAYLPLGLRKPFGCRRKISTIKLLQCCHGRAEWGNSKNLQQRFIDYPAPLSLT